MPDAPDTAACLQALRAIAPMEDETGFAPVLAAMQPRRLAAGELLLRVGDTGDRECLLLSGILRSSVADAQGREVTLAFHQGPTALTPALARADAQGFSRIDCQALTLAWVAEFPAALLVDCMLRHPAVQRWGDAVLRAELLRRADREWSLAALPAAERLALFRREHPGLEGRIAQHHVASYLGITPVSLSRLRAQERAAPRPA
jgi:CRP-like cAMP-binding protein